MSVETATLRDSLTGSEAKVLVGFGFNCYSFVVPVDVEPIETLWAVPQFAEGTQRPSSGGIPILFPFPGRIGGTSLTWEGKQYELDAGDGRGNAIHGFVQGRAWRVIEQSESRVVGQFQASIDDAAILEHWPADFCITVCYEVAGNSLRANYRVENPDQRPLPWGLGTHPYFRVPVGGDVAGACTVRVPVTSQWELVDMLPTGVQQPLEHAEDYQRGLRFADMAFDDVFGGLQSSEGRCTASIADPGSGRTLTMTFDDVFRECVVYNPPHREAVCVEPYTCVPDPFRLEREGVDAGLRVLKPGESIETKVDIRLD